ncbi:hypothetical protein AAC387_Pa02g1330 [Persea americana]
MTWIRHGSVSSVANGATERRYGYAFWITAPSLRAHVAATSDVRLAFATLLQRREWNPRGRCGTVPSELCELYIHVSGFLLDNWSLRIWPARFQVLIMGALTAH